jgi:lysophospholipase L1-like esterase
MNPPTAAGERVPPPPPRRARLYFALMLAIGLAVPFLVAEVAVRALYRYNSPDTVRSHSLQYLPTLFARHRLKPNQILDQDEAWGVKSGRQATRRVYRINDLGYRGEPFPLEKAAGTQRVIVLGGSSVFDPGASEGEDWPHLVGRKLAGQGLTHVEVINAGVPGHATFDAFGRLYTQLWTFRPDYVLIYAGWNDVKYFDKVTLDRPLLWSARPYDEHADPFQNTLGPVDRLLCHSQLYVKLRNRYWMWKLRPGTEGAAQAHETVDRYSEVGPRQFKLNLRLLVDASREIGATPVLLTEASLLASGTRSEDLKRVQYEYQSLTPEALLRTLKSCEDAVREVAKEKKAELWDTAAVLGQRSELFDDHVHLSRAGAEAISTAVAGNLVRLLGKAPSQDAPSASHEGTAPGTAQRAVQPS